MHSFTFSKNFSNQTKIGNENAENIFSIMPIYISQTEIYINALKRKISCKYNATKEYNLLHTGLNTEKSHSTLSFKCCTHICIYYLKGICSFNVLFYKKCQKRGPMKRTKVFKKL